MLPDLLSCTLQKQIELYSLQDLKKSAFSVSQAYRNAERKGQRLVASEADVLSYALTRMPATFEVIANVLNKLPTNCQSMIDVGAGTGAGAWAVLQGGYAQNILCLEREPAMLDLGQLLLSETYPEVEWKLFDLVTQEIAQRADIVLSSYVLNELADVNRLRAVEKMWQATKRYLIIIDNGTPDAFDMMKKIRSYLIELGGFVVAPCPCAGACPNSWCHFTTRVARTKVHKFLKEGQAPFEDEKFTYLIFSKTPEAVLRSRVLRHPKIEKGKISLELCSAAGIVEKTISKKDGNLFKKARKLNAGDTWVEIDNQVIKVWK